MSFLLGYSLGVSNNQKKEPTSNVIYEYEDEKNKRESKYNYSITYGKVKKDIDKLAKTIYKSYDDDTFNDYLESLEDMVFKSSDNLFKNENENVQKIKEAIVYGMFLNKKPSASRTLSDNSLHTITFS
jgi:hypothetical protein